MTTENTKTFAYRLTQIDEMSENITDIINSQKIYMPMARMYSNAEIPGRYFGASSQLINWILESGVTCHMTPEISDFIPGLLAETDQYIEVADGLFSKRNKQEKFK